jgi:hypothetical protein
MRESTQAHRARPWRVHDIAADFELLDVWAFDLGGSRPTLDDFLARLWPAMEAMSGSPLMRARVAIGRVLGWDDHDFTLPIPGCEETTVGARLSDADRAQSRAAPGAPSPLSLPELRPIYVLSREALYKLSNATIHALVHVSTPQDAPPVLAV